MSENKKRGGRKKKRSPPNSGSSGNDDNGDSVPLEEIVIDSDDPIDGSSKSFRLARSRVVSRAITEKDDLIHQKDEEIIRKEEALNEKEQLLHQKETEMTEKANDFNAYATSKSVSQNFLNTTSIASQITLLVLLFAASDGDLTGFQVTLVILIVMSLSLQFTMFVLLVVLAQAKDEKIGRSCTATRLNTWVTSLSGLLMIISTAITAVTLKADINDAETSQ
jgi:hypothetical protein